MTETAIATERFDEMHDCTMKGQYITVRTAIIAVFAIMTPIVTIASFYVDSIVSSAGSKIELKLLSINEKIKQNELRIVRLEDAQLKNAKTSSEAIRILREIQVDLKYKFATKDELKKGLESKVDMSRIDKRTLKD